MAHTDELYPGRGNTRFSVNARPARRCDAVTARRSTQRRQLPNTARQGIVRTPTLTRIKSIDVARPKNAGVLRVVTADDFPNLTRSSPSWVKRGKSTRPHLAATAPKARSYTEATPWPWPRRTSSRKKRRRNQVDYEVLPSVTWVLDALKDGAPPLHQELLDSMGKKGDKPTNAAVHLHRERECRRGLCAGGCRRRARIPHGERAPGIHRAACHGRELERR